MPAKQIVVDHYKCFWFFIVIKVFPPLNLDFCNLSPYCSGSIVNNHL